MERQEMSSVTELKPKVRALYDAVLELLREGADINAMKVADITSRAGIGKGTAYDYFKSKEDIIAGAIVYDAREQGQLARKKLETIPDFASRVRYYFCWVEECVREKKAFGRFLFLGNQPGGCPDELLKKMKQMHKELDSECDPMEILKELCIQGKREGYIREEICEDTAAYMLLGNMAALFLYMGKEKENGISRSGEMREFLCEGFLKTVK